MITAEAMVAALSCAAVLSWPPRSAASQRLRVGPATSKREPADQPALPGLDPELVMDLVACALRAGLPVGDALACAARAAEGSGAGNRPDPGRPDPSSGAGYLNGVVGRLRLGVPGPEAWGPAPPA